MARPVKWRKIENLPAVAYFIPSDTDIPQAAKNVLLLEELEAVRLKDLEGLEQEECAERMQVSRPTFQRILLSAREKVADSLVNGKVLHVAGGNYTRHVCNVRCFSCGREWTDSYENLKAVETGGYLCPHCGSPQISCSGVGTGNFCRRNRCRHGQHTRGGPFAPDETDV